ncbi:MAG: hypothetical protein R6V05_04215 [Candidatus Brocadiia bacterium]
MNAVVLMGELTECVEQRRQAAQRNGDEAQAAELQAVVEVLRTRYIPLACPDALVVARQATRAAHEGIGEAEWYRQAHDARAQRADDLRRLNEAVRILRRGGLWPWDVRSRPADQPGTQDGD